MPAADWRDAFATDETGRVTSWTRTRPGRDPETFTADGARILDPGATPPAVEAVRYPLTRDAAGRLVVEELSTGILIEQP